MAGGHLAGVGKDVKAGGAGEKAGGKHDAEGGKKKKEAKERTDEKELAMLFPNEGWGVFESESKKEERGNDALGVIARDSEGGEEKGEQEPSGGG